MLHNNINQVEAYKANQSTIKTIHKKNMAYYQLLAATKGKTADAKVAYDYPSTSTPNQEIITDKSMSFNTTRELDISDSNNHDYLCNNLPDIAYNILPKHFKTFKRPIGKKIQNKIQLFESMKQKNESVVTKQENIQSEIAELNCTANETHQSKLNGDVIKELHKIRCQKSYTPLTPMPKLSDINELNLEKSNFINSTDILSASKFHPTEERSIHLSSTTSDSLESSSNNKLLTDLLPSLNAFDETCNKFDSVPEPIITNYDQDVIGASL